MKRPIAILLSSSPCGSSAHDPTTGSPAQAATWAGPFLTERTHDSDSR
jgi:hypothetical protein